MRPFYCFLLISLLGFSLATAPAFAQTSGPLIVKTANLAVVGLASSETVQVSVVNLSSSVLPVVTGGTLPSGGTTANCAGGITFYDANGNAITSATFTIGSGQIYSAPLAYSAIPPADRPAGNGRASVWATVTINGAQTSDTPCLLGSNIETFDTASGVTHVHVEGARLAILSRVVGNPPVPGPVPQ